ncbi:MAG: hypothetical protein WKF35_11110 [Ferruginibacter sp.]
MKKLDFILVRTVVFFLLINSTDFVSAQTLINRPNTYINSNCNGYVEFLPSTYNTNSDSYPLLIFVHGNSQWGPGTNASLQIVRDLGPNYWANVFLDPNNHWLDFPGRHDLNKMVMISPQFVGPSAYDGPPSPAHINSVIDYACNNYRIDRSRIYVCGPSYGGKWTLEYAAAYPYRVAAIVPFAAAVWSIQGWADTFASTNLPIWMVNNLYDPIVGAGITQVWIAAINNPTPPIVPPTPRAHASYPVGTYPLGYDHEYDYNYRGLDTATNGLNKNMYKWMLQYSRANYFLGGAGSAWENANNWSYNQVPNANTDVIINTGPVIINSNASCKKITLKPGVNLTVNTGYKLTVTQ